MGQRRTIELAAVFCAACLLAACGSNSGGSGQDSGAGATEGGPRDTGSPDLGAPDTAAADSGAPEASSPDGGARDTGAPDMGAPDMGAPDTGAGDTGSPDAGADAGPNPDCAANNGGADCTPTEALFEAHSPDCYKCLVNAGCLDDALIPVDSMHECADVPGTAVKGAKSGQARSSLCLETIRCILRTQCAATDTALCYCGSLGAGNGCTTSTVASAANGACLQTELDGLEHLSTEAPVMVAPDFYNVNLGGGKANEIFACAAGNGGCPACLQ
jgi:hypothetical protein